MYPVVLVSILVHSKVAKSGDRKAGAGRQEAGSGGRVATKVQNSLMLRHQLLPLKLESE